MKTRFQMKNKIKLQNYLKLKNKRLSNWKILLRKNRHYNNRIKF